MSVGEVIKQENVCRTCLSCTSILQPLFPYPGQISTFVRALYFSTGLRIQVNDGLPQNICNECLKIIENSIQFRVQCQETEKKLLKYFDYVAMKEDLSDFDYSNEPEYIEIKINSKNNLATELKSEIEDLHQPLIDDTNLSSEDERLLNYKCNSASKAGIVPSIEPVKKKPSRQTDNYDRKRYLELIEGPVVSKQPIQCKICKKYSKCLNSFEKHAMSHLGYNILCEFCAKSCISKANLLRHQRRKHGLARDNSFPCPVCKFQAIDKEQLEVHERKVHTKERPFVCNNCGASFYSKRVLIQHEANHKTDQPFQCDLCPLKFKLRCQLTKHIHRVHTKNYLKYTYGCYICFKKYSRTHHVRKHVFKIHGVPIKQQEKIQRFELKNSFSAPFTVSPNLSPNRDHN